MITSPHNEKLKRIRKLRSHRERERTGLFVAEGEDLVAAAAAAGAEPELVLVAGEDVEPALLSAVSTLGSGTRVIGVYRQRWSRIPAKKRPGSRRRRRNCLSTSTGSPTRATSAPSSAPRTRSATARSCSGRAAPTPIRRRRCEPAWARCSPVRRRGPSSPS